MALTIFPLAATPDTAQKREGVERARISSVAYVKIAGANGILAGAAAARRRVKPRAGRPGSTHATVGSRARIAAGVTPGPRRVQSSNNGFGGEFVTKSVFAAGYR